MVAGSPVQPPPEPAPQERYGPLALAFVRKDDGRSLILYSHDEDREDAVETSQPPRPGRRDPA
jgi:hypothetical protein